MEAEKQSELAVLLTKAQKGDEAALLSLCTELETYFREFFHHKFKDKNIIDDLCQETHIKLLENLTTIRDGMKLKSFVTKVAFHTMHDYFRQKYNKQEEPLESGFEDTNPNGREKLFIEMSETDKDEKLLSKLDLENALNGLPEKSKIILTLKSDGYSYEEIAAKTKISVSGVKMQVKRSIEQLKFSLFIVTFLLIKTSLF